MKKNMTPGKIFRFLTLMAPSCALPALSTLAPALANIGEAFPEMSDVAIQNLYTITYLTAFPMVYSAGRLASRFTKKQILTVALSIMLVFGSLPLLFHNSYWVLLACAAAYGVGSGLLSPMTSALISEHTEPEQRGWMLGVQSAVLGVVGMLFAFLGGYLAEIRWWLAYGTFLLLIPILGLTLCLPEGIVAPKLEAQEKIFSPALLLILGFAVVHHGFSAVYQTNISMLVGEMGLGGSDVAGIITAFQHFAGILGGLITGYVLRKLGDYSLPVICAVSAVGMLMCLVGGMGAMICGTFLLGMLASMRMPAGYTQCSALAPHQSALMIALYCSSTQVGTFLSPYAVDVLVPNGSAEGRMLLAGVVMGVAGVLMVVKTWHDRKKAAASK